MDYCPAWSPTASTSRSRRTATANYEIYVMKADGTGVRNLTGHPGYDISRRWSPDGRRLPSCRIAAVAMSLHSGNATMTKYPMTKE